MKTGIINKTRKMMEGSPKKGKSKYPFKDLQVGHSFPVEESKRFSVATLAKKFGDSQEPVWAFSVSQDEKGELNCWRVK